ncbi:MAG TPA: 16S rRNA (cytosine(1402)-N(4))-methyltransferase [Verrucomicrobiales bacterium]|nr:16S rRNA (cytosine(1402)-N(4))-methyltransferase [Verrucomicrobiales bacterium]|tara:strand:- start:28 stop:960 length:933 start_codon:yes stop_codon:yes gene_type:complete
MEAIFHHVPVLAAEVIEALRPASGGRYLDGTLGGGGHAKMILKASSPDGKLWGTDRDESAIAAASSRLAAFGDRVEITNDSYSNAAGWVAAGTLDGVLLDLGVSSPQLDHANRGFSVQTDGPLDMRMDQTQALTAAEVVNTWSEAELAAIIWKYGGDRDSRRIARAIAQARAEASLETTGHLAEVVAGAKRRGRHKKHPAVQVFQAVRIAVNNELDELTRGLEGAFGLLKPGGRLAVITFHSLEDRMVKEFGNEHARDYDVSGEVDVPMLRVDREPRMRWVSRKSIRPADAEVEANPRARSAQLRVLEKV